MKLGDLITLLNAEVHYLRNDDKEKEVRSATACDLMSDILASVNVPDILLTGLNNAQVIRTSSVFGIKAVVIARGRTVDPKLVELAREEDVTLLSTKDSLFAASGKLFNNGMKEASAPSK